MSSAAHTFNESHLEFIVFYFNKANFERFLVGGAFSELFIVSMYGSVTSVFNR